jgi:hypothetical protein
LVGTKVSVSGIFSTGFGLYELELELGLIISILGIRLLDEITTSSSKVKIWLEIELLGIIELDEISIGLALLFGDELELATELELDLDDELGLALDAILEIELVKLEIELELLIVGIDWKGLKLGGVGILNSPRVDSIAGALATMSLAFLTGD